MQKEIWKDVPGYEGSYQVSNLGRVKGLDRKIRHPRNTFRIKKGQHMKQVTNRNGYKTLRLSLYGKTKTFTVHQLVAMAFLNHKPDGTNKIVVDHLNNIRKDNRLENLQLINNRENCSKDLKNGTSKYIGVSWDKQKNKWRSVIKINGRQSFIGRFKCELAAAAAYQKELIKLNK